MDVATLGYAVDTSQVKSGTRDLDDHAKAAGQAATAAQGFTDKSAQGAPIHDRATSSIRGQREQIRSVAEAAMMTGGPLGDMISRSGLLYIGSLRVSAGLIATTVAVSAVVAAVVKAVEAYAAFESRQAALTNALNATGGASGQSAPGLDELAKQLAKTGTQSVTDLQGAEAELLKFRSVSGDTFTEVMKLSKDVAATGFADLKTSAKALAQSLSDPTTATQVLSQVGLQLSVQQQRLATDFYNAGQVAKAQQVILKAVSDQVAGSDAAAADTLNAAYGRLTGSGTGLLEAWGKQIAEGTNLKGILSAIADQMERAAKASKEAADQEAALRALGAAARAGTLVQNSSGNYELPKQPSLSDSLSKLGTAQPPFKPEEWNAFRAAMEQAQQRLDAVTDSLQQQLKVAAMNATEQRVYAEAVKAGAVANQDASASIRNQVNALQLQEATTQATAATITQTSSLRSQAGAVNLSAGAAAALVFEQQMLAQQTAKGGQITDEFRAKVHSLAQEIGAASQVLANAQWGKQLADQIRTVTSNLQTQTATLYMSAGAAKQYEFVQQTINEALQKNRPLSEAQVAALVKATAAMRQFGDVAEHASFMKGISDDLNKQVAALNAEGESFRMQAGAQAAYRYEKEKIAEAIAKNNPLTTAEIAILHQEAQAYGQVVQKVQNLKDAKQATDAINSSLVDGFYSVVTGANTASQAILNFSNAILKMVMQAALAGQGPLAGLFGTASGGGLFGGLFSGLFSAFKLHDGGIVGAPNSQSIMIPPHLVQSAPRYHSGISNVGMAADERLTVLQTGEDVRSRAQVASDRRMKSNDRMVHVYSPVTVIAPDAPSFNQSRGQVGRTITQSWQQAARRFN